MAVTLNAAQLAAAIRVGTTAQETAQVTRLLSYATAAVTKHAPDAPDSIQDEAVIRLAGYLFDQPTYIMNGRRPPNALRSSGAAAILQPYRSPRARNVAAEAVSTED